MINLKNFFAKTILTGLLIVVAFSAKTSLAIEYGMLGGKPANPDPKIENSASWFIYNIDAGESKQDAITIMNLFDSPLDVIVYAADSTPSSNGGFALKQLTESKDEVGSWIKFYPAEPPSDFLSIYQKHNEKILEFCGINHEALQEEYGKKIITSDQFLSLEQWCQGSNLIDKQFASKETVEIPFTISVPQSADVGEHTGGILIQKKAVDDQTDQQGSSVKLTTRVGVRIYETVPGDIVKKLVLDDFKISKNFKEFSFSDWFGEKKVKTYTVQTNISNSGNVSVEHDNNIVIQNLLFKKESQTVERKFQILKGDKFIANMTWNKPLFGYYSFQAQIKYQNGDNEQVLSSAPIKIWIIPWREMVLTLILLTILIGAYIGWRIYRKKKYGGVGWVSYTVRDGDTVMALSNKFSIDWKVFVKTNKIKAPYLLEAGQVITVPNLENLSIAEDKVEMPYLETIEKTETKAVGRKRKTAVLESPILETQITEPVIKESEIAEKPAIMGFITKPRLALVKKIAIYVLIFAGICLVIAAAVVLFRDMKKNKISENMSISSLTVSENNNAKTEETAKDSAEQTVDENVNKVDPLEMKIEVLNSNAVPGTAGKIKEFLAGKGYKNVEAKNAQGKINTGTTVYYAQENLKTEAEWIGKILEAEKIKAEVKIAVSDEEKSGDVVIILGR